MKNLIYLLAFVITVAFLTGCQKEEQTMKELADIEQQLQTKKSIEKENTEEIDDNINIDKLQRKASVEIEPTDVSEVSSRSGRTLILSDTYEVPAGYYLEIVQPKEKMNPDCKYYAKITRYAGDPDLYIYGSNIFTRNYRQIRRATIISNGVYEETYVAYSDLLSSENALIYSIRADQNLAARFKLEIYEDSLITPSCYKCLDKNELQIQDL